MTVTSIAVESFRNIRSAALEFSPAVNVLCGNNAQGKTNLLEAIAVALGRSFRNIRRTDIIPHDYTDSRTKITMHCEPRRLISWEQNNVTLNGIPLKKAVDLYGEFKYVVFTPDSLSLIKGYPDSRRSWLDNIAVMQNKAHSKCVSEYKSALNQRCFAYRPAYSGNPGITLVWDDILIRQGINLTYGRLKYLNMIREYAAEIYGELAPNEQLGISYMSDVYGEINELSLGDKSGLYNAYAAALSKSDGKSAGDRGKTAGAHKDDVLFTLNGKSARTFASQGQIRSIIIALKLAEARMIREFNRENPVVLLDEVLGELDSDRRDYVLKHFDKSQVFITTCNNHDFDNLHDLKVWSVENGVFTPRE
jgi:DNA replication and repair protein RecF